MKLENLCPQISLACWTCSLSTDSSLSIRFLSATAPWPFPFFFLFPHLSSSCPHFFHDSRSTHSTLSTDSYTPGMPPLLHSHPQPLHPLTPSPPGWPFFCLFFLLSIWIVPIVVFFPCTFKNCFYATSVSLSFHEIIKKRRE